ncbi:MAG: GNAT family N-acetyltransferase [Oscillospiraceae bacterium]|nr:GNAT family N-acetyltransferase [Oscillospiraceae bacterium]
MSIRLVKPTAEYAEDIMAFRAEFAENGEVIDGGSMLENYSSADEWLAHLDEFSNSCPEGFAPSDTFLAVNEDNSVVGIIDCRRHIDLPFLGECGGHIGYSVRKSERRKGHAKEMLRQALDMYRERGIGKVLVTCYVGNTASEKTILANGGVFERETGDSSGHRIKRFWITL